MSGFNTNEEQQELHQYDIKPPPKSKKETIAVPILKREHIGPSMAIDEKHIDGKFYTILSNNETGKVALMAATHTKKELDQAMIHFGDLRHEVRTLTRDLSNTYDWLGREHFLNAGHVADKFHILRHLFEAVHDIRIFHRQSLLTKKRLEQEQKRNGLSIDKPTKETPLENGDTHAELLARSIHLLYKKEDQWNASQAARAKVLFKYYPDIEKSCRLALKFRDWYDKSNVGKDMNCIKEELQKWLDEAGLNKSPEMLNFKALVERHSGIICNYFIAGQTNAKAEAINKKIQSIISNYVNTCNINFAHFRLKNILS